MKMKWKITVGPNGRKILIGAIQVLVILVGLMIMFTFIRRVGWNNQDAVGTVAMFVTAGMMFLCWGIPRWTGLRENNMKVIGLDDDLKNGIKYLTWTVLLIIGVVGGLWLLWNGAAWLIARFVGTIQSYR